MIAYDSFHSKKAIDSSKFFHLQRVQKGTNGVKRIKEKSNLSLDSQKSSVVNYFLNNFKAVHF